MKWGYKYENHDIVLNHKSEGSDLTKQGLEIWCKQEKAEYYTKFGIDRNFFTTNDETLIKEAVKKINDDIYIPPNTEASFEFEKPTTEELKVKIVFK
jgi:hypothetical protein